jgi:hypothetical protein
MTVDLLARGLEAQEAGCLRANNVWRGRNEHNVDVAKGQDWSG